jgi:1,4-dihydroxy-2-naphthoyl-CoA hydrolase
MAIGFTREELMTAPPRHVQARVVRFQDVDAAGIVFYPRILEYFHDAHVEFLAAGGCPLHEAIAQRRWAAPLSHAEADFFKAMRFGDPIRVAVVAARIEGTDGAMGFRVEKAGGEVAAVGYTTHVFVDFTTFKRAPPPPDLQALFAGPPC